MEPNIYTWDEYKSWVSQLVKGNMNILCRGHANEEWKLQTSFHREENKHGITLQHYLNIILPEIHYHICANCNEIIDLQKKEEFGSFLALIQHHGFPTPLLDWTYSPYIATYFAFKEVNDQRPISDNVKIYMFDYLTWAETFKQPLDLRDMSQRYVSVIRPYARFNTRIISQQGIFTLTNVDDIEAYIKEREVESKKIFLYTALISVKEKPHVLRELNLMGINEMTLFQSTEGICRAMKSRFFSADAVGPTLNEIIESYNKTETDTGITP